MHKFKIVVYWSKEDQTFAATLTLPPLLDDVLAGHTPAPRTSSAASCS